MNRGLSSILSRGITYPLTVRATSPFDVELPFATGAPSVLAGAFLLGAEELLLFLAAAVCAARSPTVRTLSLSRGHAKKTAAAAAPNTTKKIIHKGFCDRFFASAGMLREWSLSEVISI